MSNNKNNKAGRSMNLIRHQNIVQTLNETISILNQRLSSTENTAMRATETSCKYEELLNTYTELHAANISVQRDNEKLKQQINMLHDINLNTQYQLMTLQSKKSVSCQHMYQCGCGMSLCNNCTIISTCIHCDFNLTFCDYCNRSPKLCNDQTCSKYYERRFDNCDCNSLHCNFCMAKIIIKDKINNHQGRN